MFLRVKMVVNFLKIFVNMSVTRQDTCLTDLIKLTRQGIYTPHFDYELHFFYFWDAMASECSLKFDSIHVFV